MRFRTWREHILRIKKLNSSQDGIAMVELLAGMVLTGILMTAGIFVFTTCMKFFERMESEAAARKVSDLILETISGEIAASVIPEELIGDGGGFWLSEDGTELTCYDHSGRRMTVCASEYDEDLEEGGGLVMWYQENTADVLESESDPASLWKDEKFDKTAYMGFRITKLLFSRPTPESHPEVIRIDLTLYDPRTGAEYSTNTYAVR